MLVANHLMVVLLPASGRAGPVFCPQVRPEYQRACGCCRRVNDPENRHKLSGFPH